MTNHFDEIDYDAELPIHIRDYLVERKCGKMFDFLLPRFRWHKKIHGIDLGCGMGHHVVWFNHIVNLQVVGIDTCTPNFKDYCYPEDIRDLSNISPHDFAYTINVLHHLPSREDQLKAIREAARILRPDGLFFIHELNFRNFFIGLYVKHIFRHIRNIDQGNECWFDPKLLKQMPEFKLIAKEYFTFTPDFCPKWIMPLFRKIDKWVDGKWVARFGAHIMYVLEKQ